MESNLIKIYSILEKYNLSPKTFCIAPYLIYDFDQSGEMHSCFQGKRALGNWKESPAKKQYNSIEYQNLRKFQRIGNRKDTYANCENCYRHEKHKVPSTRTANLLDYYNRIGPEKFEEFIKQISQTPVDQVDMPNVDFVEMRLSNYCNLRCLHCDHISSTSWMNFFTNQENLERARQSGIPIHPDVDSKNIMKYFSKYQSSDTEHLNDVVDIMSKGRVLTWSGGEPLMDPNYLKIMDQLVENKNCSNQILDIHTNLNIKNIEKYLNHWKKFEIVNLYISLDCPPSTYKFFRRNGDWNTVMANVDAIRQEIDATQINIMGHITFTMFGALRYKEIADVWTEKNLNSNANLVVVGPTSARYLPEDLKQSAINQMEQVIENKEQMYSKKLISDTEKCLTYTKNTEKHTFLDHQVIKWLQLMDKTSDLKTLDFYPELKEYYNS